MLREVTGGILFSKWQSLSDIGVPVYVYSTFNKGEAAKETA